MLDRHGQFAGPGALMGLAREAGMFWPLAGALIFSRLGLALMDMVDGVMLAHHSSRQLAFYGLADALASRVLDVGLALMLAGLALARQASDADPDEQHQVGRIWQQALLLASLLGLAGMVLGAVAPGLLALLGQPALLAQGGGSVLTILSLGILPGLLAMATAGLLQAIGRPGVVVLAVLVANVQNLLLNLMLIDGVSGGPPLGASGVAWSTVLVRWTLAIALLAVAWWLPQQSRFGLRLVFKGRDWHASADQRAVGWTAAGRAAALAPLPLGLVLMAGGRGEQALAVFTALGLVMLPGMAMGWGLADAAGQRVTAVLEFARKRPGSVSRCGERCTLLALALLLLVMVLYGLALPTLVPLVGLDISITRQVVQLVPLGLTVVLAESLACQAAASLRSLGEQRRPFAAQALISIVALPLAGVLAFGLNGGVAGLLAAQGVAAALRAFVLGRQYRHAAHQVDNESAHAQYARAQAIAHGYADTVMMWPADKDGGEPRTTARASPRAAPGGRRAR